MASYSSVLSLNKCSFSYLFKKKYGWKGNRNLAFGIAFHHGSEIYSENKDRTYAKDQAATKLREYSSRTNEDYVDLLMENGDISLEDAIEKMVKDIELLNKMLDRLFDAYEEYGIEFETTELKLEHTFSNGVNYLGYVDGVVLVDGKRYLLELKTAKNITTNHLEVDLQIAIYIAIFKKEFDMDINGMIWISNKKGVPKKPKIGKTGVSVAKNQGTTPPLYEKALVEVYGSVEDAPQRNLDFLENLKTNGTEYISVHVVEKTEESLEKFYKIFESYAEDQDKLDQILKKDGLMAALNSTRCTPNLMCTGMCDFRADCEKYFAGGTIE